jgi:hypothetical protein
MPKKKARTTRSSRTVDVETTATIPDTLNPEVNYSIPMSFRVLLTAITLGFIALLATIISILSTRQAPPNPPLEEMPVSQNR